MPRPQRVTTEEILEASRAHFIKRGHSASLKSIASDLGLSHSAILQRFGSKRALMIKALEPPIDYPWPNGFLEGPNRGDEEAIDQLRLTCLMLVQFLNRHMPWIVVLQSAGVSDEEIFEGRLPLPLVACQRLGEWIDRGISREVFRPCNSAAIASTIVGTMFVRARLEVMCQQVDLAMMTPHGGERDITDCQASLLGTMEEVMNLFSGMLINSPITQQGAMTPKSERSKFTLDSY